MFRPSHPCSALALLLLLQSASVCIARVVTYDWEISQMQAAFDGLTTTVYSINGRPGHEALIEATLGDRVEVRVVNALSETTCLHWHGLKQLGTQEMDGVSGITQCHIQPGGTAVYRFTPDKPGSFWWHSHDSTQYAFGLCGPLVVHSPPNQLAVWERQVTAEYTLQLTDWYHALPNGVPMWDSVLINYRGRFDCSVASDNNLTCSEDQPLSRIRFEQGKTYRLRLINEGALAPLLFSIDGHEFSVVAVDAEPVQPSKLINSLLINVGQRYDIIVKAKKPHNPAQVLCRHAKGLPGNFWIRATSQYSRPWTGWPVDTAAPDGFNQYGLAILDYDVHARSEPTTATWDTISILDELAFAPVVPSTLPVTPDQRVVVEFDLMQVVPNSPPLGYVSINNGNFSTLKVPDEPPLFSIPNGLHTSDLLASANAFKLDYGKHIEVVLVNDMNEQHPFHMHTRAPWVVASGQASRDAIFANTITDYNLDGPVLRDVYTVPPCNTDADGNCVDIGYLVLRFDTDNAGVWMLHCHTEWHMDTGVAMLFVEGEEKLQQRGLPSFSSNMLSTCNGKYAI